MVEGSPDTLDRAYGALSHPIRRDLLERLTESSARVTSLASRYPVSLAAVSKHVHLLEQAGLVSRSVVGRDHVITGVPRALDTAQEWLDTYRSFWDARLDALERMLSAPR
ncbi:MAG: ArsR/SmtB family transcription factor [Candidatus Dormibacteria bacterium]